MPDPGTFEEQRCSQVPKANIWKGKRVLQSLAPASSAMLGLSRCSVQSFHYSEVVNYWQVLYHLSPSANPSQPNASASYCFLSFVLSQANANMATLVSCHMNFKDVKWCISLHQGDKGHWGSRAPNITRDTEFSMCISTSLQDEMKCKRNLLEETNAQKVGTWSQKSILCKSTSYYLTILPKLQGVHETDI